MDDIRTTQTADSRRHQEHFVAQTRFLEGITHTSSEHHSFLQLAARDTQRSWPSVSAPSATYRGTRNHSLIGIRARAQTGFAGRYRQPECFPSCRCSCHTSGTVRTPQIFNKAIGTLFIGYSGSPFAFAKCRDKKCRGFSAHVTYTFPLWLLWKMIDTYLAISQAQDPHFSITVRAIVPSSAEIFRLTRSNDRIGLEKLFSSGGARPNDLMRSHERSALHVRLRFLFCRSYMLC